MVPLLNLSWNTAGETAMNLNIIWCPPDRPTKDNGRMEYSTPKAS